MALAPTQQSQMYGGSVSYDQMQQFRQQQASASFQQNLGRFAMFAGLGVARGIGAGLQATDLNNPFRGAGAAVLGGTEPGMVFANQAAQRIGEAAMFPERLQRETEAARAERRMILERAQEDKGTFRGIRRGIGTGVLNPLDEDFSIAGDDSGPISEMQQAVEQPMGLRAGLSQMNPHGKMFVAQQGLMAAREQMASERARQIMFGMSGGMR